MNTFHCDKLFHHNSASNGASPETLKATKAERERMGRRNIEREEGEGRKGRGGRGGEKMDG